MNFSSSSNPQQQSVEFWRRSFFNLLQRELNQWLPNHRKFWFSILTWTIVTYIVSGIWFLSDQDVAPPPYTSTISAWLFVASMRGVFSLQGIISEEKLTGTLAWIISKPVPRSAFYLATLFSLDNWYKLSSKAKWTNLIDVQTVYPTAEAVSNFTVFNIKGNKYRLIVDIVYTEQTIFIKYVLTHSEYDKDKWKNDPYF